MTQHWTTMPASIRLQKPFPGLYRFFALFLAQTLGSFFAMSMVTGFTRPAVFLVVVPLTTTLLCTTGRFRSKYSFLIVAAAIAATLATVQLLRNSFHATWFVGPLPASIALATYAAVAIITVVCAGCTCIVFSATGFLRLVRWPVVGIMTALLIGLVLMAKHSVWDPSPSTLPRTVVHLEQQGTADPDTVQQLCVMLANCGRDTEAESISRWAVIDGDSALPDSTARPIDASKFRPLPWRTTLSEIAKREQIIMIMEAHNAPKHRQWIEQTLPILRTAGFGDYAAEGLGESGPSLVQRGYPVPSTGFYVSDPHFGNVLRTAIELEFEIHAYESYGNDFGQREYAQAANLAKLFARNPNLKLVVHAGYAHVLKKPLKTGEKMMAAHLWEMTGIEPYCIWQTYHSPDEGDARQLAALVESGSEPVMLVPAPSELHDPQFGFPMGAVDALVVHSPSVGGPAERVHSFQAERRHIVGVWNGSEWPVIFGAFKKGEPTESIALDQVMLREGERDFALWVPYADFEIRVFGEKGQINPINSDGSSSLIIDTEHRIAIGSTGAGVGACSVLESH